MAVTTALVVAACNTTTGNQSFTTTDFGGGTPTSCLIFSAGSTIAGAEAEYRFLYGSAVGTSEQSSFATSDDNVSTTNTRRTTGSGGIVFIDPNGTADGNGAVSMITNGININWTTAPGVAQLLTVVLFGGADLSAHQHSWGSLNDLATSTATTSFQPHLIFGGTSDAVVYTSTYSDAGMAHGVYDYNGGATARKGSMAATSNDNQGTASTGSQYDSTHLLAWPNQNTGAAEHYIDVSAIGSTSYTVQNQSGSTTRNGWSQAINVGTKGYKAWEQASPTATGDWAVTGVGFKPQLVIGFLGWHTVAGAVNSGTGAGVHAVCAFTPNDESCETGMLEDGATSAIRSKGLHSRRAIELTFADGTSGYRATFVSMDADGFTLNFSAANGTSRKWVFIAIEEEAAGDTSNLAAGSSTVTGYVPGATHTQNLRSNLVQAEVNAAGFAPSVTLTQGDQSVLELGTATSTGFVPTVTHSQNHRSNLVQGVATSAAFAPTVTLTQNQRSNLEAGSSTLTGFAPTATLLEGDQSILAQGAATVAGFDLTITHTQNHRSNLEAGVMSFTGYAPISTVALGDVSNLAAGAVTATGFAPSSTLEQNAVSNLELGTVTFTGFAPTTEVTGVAAPVKRQRGGGGGRKHGYYRKIMIGGIVYTVSSPEEELALWERYLAKTREEKPGRQGEIEARSIERKIRVVAKQVAAAEIQANVDPRKNDTLLMKYIAARRSIVRAKIQELLDSLR